MAAQKLEAHPDWPRVRRYKCKPRWASRYIYYEEENDEVWKLSWYTLSRSYRVELLEPDVVEILPKGLKVRKGL